MFFENCVILKLKYIVFCGTVALQLAVKSKLHMKKATQALKQVGDIETMPTLNKESF